MTHSITFLLLYCMDFIMYSTVPISYLSSSCLYCFDKRGSILALARISVNAIVLAGFWQEINGTLSWGLGRNWAKSLFSEMGMFSHPGTWNNTKLWLPQTLKGPEEQMTWWVLEQSHRGQSLCQNLLWRQGRNGEVDLRCSAHLSTYSVICTAPTHMQPHKCVSCVNSVGNSWGTGTGNKRHLP